MLSTATSILSSISFLTLTAGVVLYYILPFLPFLYFFFAVGTWVMSIFEAMVGVPLWALAHLRIDGEGLPGDAASGGYFLIFEIFLRPILSVFGLIAALIIFTAQVRVLNVIWDVVLGNLTGSGTSLFMLTGAVQEPRNELDTFFYTLLYIAIIYMMATASFKLIDKIPDNILRFMGTGTSTFSDINQDPTEGLTKYVGQGGITFGREITGAATDVGKGVGGAFANLFKSGPKSPSAGTGG
jgi:conjugal transfer/type IV secretion protein DotA/TraY